MEEGEQISPLKTENTPLEFDSEADAMSSGTSPSETEAVTQNTNGEEESNFTLNEAELNRQFNQLQSDMATSTVATGEAEDMVFIEPICSDTYVDQTGEVDQDTLIFA